MARAASDFHRRLGAGNNRNERIGRENRARAAQRAARTAVNGEYGRRDFCAHIFASFQCIQDTFLFNDTFGIVTNEANKRELFLFDLVSRRWTRRAWFELASGLDFFDIEPQSACGTLYYHAVVERKQSKLRPTLSVCKIDSYRMELRRAGRNGGGVCNYAPKLQNANFAA